MEPVREVLFLRKLQRLLDEGEFVATHKFALLLALADLSVEADRHDDGPLPLSLDRIAEKFIEYYWRQVLPFRDNTETGGHLMHSAGTQAAIVRLVTEARSRCYGVLAVGRRDQASWGRLVREVARTVEIMPLWKLQVVAGTPDEFLYRRADYADRRITLLPAPAGGYGSARSFPTIRHNDHTPETQPRLGPHPQGTRPSRIPHGRSMGH